LHDVARGRLKREIVSKSDIIAEEIEDHDKR
jgi:hypothetical protein